MLHGILICTKMWRNSNQILVILNRIISRQFFSKNCELFRQYERFKALQLEAVPAETVNEFTKYV